MCTTYMYARRCAHIFDLRPNKVLSGPDLGKASPVGKIILRSSSEQSPFGNGKGRDFWRFPEGPGLSGRSYFGLCPNKVFARPVLGKEGPVQIVYCADALLSQKVAVAWQIGALIAHF